MFHFDLIESERVDNNNVLSFSLCPHLVELMQLSETDISSMDSNRNNNYLSSVKLYFPALTLSLSPVCKPCLHTTVCNFGTADTI